MDTPEVNSLPHSHSHSHHETAWLGFDELRHQLDVLVDVSDTLRAHLELERDQAARRGDAPAARALERGVLQVTRVRNDVRCACNQLDEAHLAAAHPHHLAAA
jgi:hypothetical protein